MDAARRLNEPSRNFRLLATDPGVRPPRISPVATTADARPGELEYEPSGAWALVCGN